MCGRYATSRTADQLVDDFGASLAGVAADIPVDYNVAPTKRAPILVARSAGDRRLVSATWGLVPSWSKDPSVGQRMINARTETVTEKPSFRQAFATQRAVIPMDGFYEWYQGPTLASGRPAKQPFFLSGNEGSRGIAVAGLYELWRRPDRGWLVSFAILTTAADGDDGRLHDRAPWLVAGEAIDAWLEPTPRPAPELLASLRPATPGRLRAWPVSTEVNYVRNNGPELIRPLPVE